MLDYKYIYSQERYLSPEQKARAELEAFVNNEGLDDLAELFGVPELPEDQHERLMVLQGIATDHWDFRKGAERQAVAWDDSVLDRPGSIQNTTIFRAADKLGLVQSSEVVNRNPEFLVILGGANHSPLNRLKYGLENVDSFDDLIFLGCSRKLSDGEKEKVADYTGGVAETEFDLGCRAFEYLLGAELVDGMTIAQEVEGEGSVDSFEFYVYEFEINGVTKQAIALSTPPRVQGHRATTYDNYAFLARELYLEVNPDTTIVASTSGVYTKGQHLPAVQEITLKCGIVVETIGHSAEYTSSTRRASEFLQETKAALDAALQLEKAIDSRNRAK